MTMLMGSLPLASWGVSGQKIPLVPLKYERLADLNIARAGHCTYWLNGEVVVMGGHTSGFVPTATAEYYRDGTWHQVDMVYPHDQGLSEQLSNGQVMIAGGHQQSLGIGQTFTVELYDPATHTFSGYGCMDKKRCFASTLPMDSGRVIIAGNWYERDGIECYDGTRQNSFVKEVAQQRSMPYMFRTARDNAIIFSNCDIHAEAFDTIIIDRLKGEPFTVPLFKTWRPFYFQTDFGTAHNFIGDEKSGYYAYLMTAINKDGNLRFLTAKGEDFALLPTAAPIPMKSPWGRIQYMSNVFVNKQKSRAYVIGYGADGDNHLYVLGVDYTILPAELTLYYTEPIDEIGFTTPILNDEGNLVMVGGAKVRGNNFEPQPTAYVFYLNGYTDKGGLVLVWWIVAAGVLLTGTLAYLIIYRRRRRQEIEALMSQDANEQFMMRIDQVMVNKQLFRNCELKVSDVARELMTNTRYVSACIKQQRGLTFVQYANSHRVAYAQQMLLQNPNKKIAEIYIDAGFSNETTFFRTFKALTGQTPREWIQKNDEDK